MMRTDPQKRVIVGKILGAHGIHGTVRLFPLTDFPERFGEMKELFLEMEGRPSRVLKLISALPYEGKEQFLLEAEGIGCRDEAEALKGYSVTVAPQERPSLDSDEYWIDDLVGLCVRDAVTGAELGVVEDVIVTGSNDVYAVRTKDVGVRMLPALGDVILEVNLKEGFMKVAVPEGLWD